MERIYQMNVVPDMLPELHPSFDLRIRYLAPPPKNNYLRTRVKRKLRQVEPGIFLLPEQVRHFLLRLFGSKSCNGTPPIDEEAA